jgi:hypothetical protein
MTGALFGAPFLYIYSEKISIEEKCLNNCFCCHLVFARNHFALYPRDKASKDHMARQDMA